MLQYAGLTSCDVAGSSGSGAARWRPMPIGEAWASGNKRESRCISAARRPTFSPRVACVAAQGAQSTRADVQMGLGRQGTNNWQCRKCVSRDDPASRPDEVEGLDDEPKPISRELQFRADAGQHGLERYEKTGDGSTSKSRQHELPDRLLPIGGDNSRKE